MKTETRALPETRASDPGAGRTGRFGPGLVFLALLAAFAPTVWSFAGTWSHETMAHGWLIAGLVAWLAWRHRGDFRRGDGLSPLLLVPLAALSLFWLLATVARIQVFHQATLLLVGVVWALYVSGRRAVRAVLVIGATFGLAVPVWGVLVGPLQRMTAVMSGGLVTLMGIPAQLEGDLIHIPAGTFLVADGCAGTGFFLSALTVGALYAHLMIRNWRGQVAVLAAAAGMALLANWTRVALLVVIGHVTEMQSRLITQHYGFGWLIFTIGLVPFLLVAGWIARRSDRGGVASAPAEPLPGAEQHRRMMRRAMTAGAVAATGPLLFHVFSVLPSRTVADRPLDVLAGGGGWVRAEQARPFSWRPEYQGASRHETPVFTRGAAQVFGDRFVFERQAQGAKLIGYPNRLAEPDAVMDDRVVGPVDADGRRWVRQAVVATPEGAVLTWYLYRVGGVEATHPAVAKLLEVPAFFTRQRTAELLALSVPCDDDGCDGAFRTLAAFTGARVGAGVMQD